MKKIYITHVRDVQPHPNADNLELVYFSEGKRCCVAQKGEFTKNQKVIRILPEVYLAKKTHTSTGLNFSWIKRFVDDCAKNGKHYVNRHNYIQVKNIRGVESYGIVIPFDEVRDEIERNVKKISKVNINKQFWRNPKNYDLICKGLGVAHNSYERNVLDGSLSLSKHILMPMVSKIFPSLTNEDTIDVCPYSLSHVFMENYLDATKKIKEKEKEYAEKYL